jgi:hypothetical protein
MVVCSTLQEIKERAYCWSKYSSLLWRKGWDLLKLEHSLDNALHKDLIYCLEHEVSPTTTNFALCPPPLWKENRNCNNMYFTVKPPISKIPCEVIVLFSLCSIFCQSFPMRAISYSCQATSLQAFVWNNFLVSLMKQFSYEFPMWSNFSLSFPCEANFHVFSLVLAEVHRSKYHGSIASSAFQCRIIILFSTFHVKNRVLYTILKDQRWNCLLIIIQAQLTNDSCNQSQDILVRKWFASYLIELKVTLLKM